MGYSLSRHSGTVWDAHIAGSYLVGSGTTERCFGAPVTWIWDFETGKLIAELRDYTAPLALYGSTLATVYCLSVSENQCALQSLALWNIVDQSSYHILASQGRNYTDVEFSSNGEWLAAATDTGRIDIWLVNASE
jgi:WD40 repeat protein